MARSCHGAIWPHVRIFTPWFACMSHSVRVCWPIPGEWMLQELGLNAVSEQVYRALPDEPSLDER